MAVSSNVSSYGGVPTLFVNDMPISGPAYMTYIPQRADYDAFAKMGYRLYSVCVFFATRPVNAAEQCGPFMPGIFEKEGAPDFSIINKELERVLQACPDALIFPRVNVNLPQWWEEAHQEACNDKGVKGKPPRGCPASQLWQDTVSLYLRQLIRHLENSPYADHIIGYQIAGGQTEEWMAIDMDGNQGQALRDAFRATYPSENNPVKFREFASEANAAAIIRLTRLAKEEVSGRKVIGVFYGYTFETPWWQSAHSAMATMLREDSIDFFCSPASYIQKRKLGIDLASMTILDSIKIHGKLYFVEADIRTCQTLSLPESCPSICEKPNYTGGLWEGPKDPWACVQQIRAAFGRMLTHGHALWWFDMWGKWYDHPLLREEMANYPDLALQAQEKGDRQSIAELAVFIDEKACARSEYPSGKDPARLIAYDNRIPLGYAGLPFDLYDISDFETVSERYHCALFLVPWETEAMTVAILKWKQSDRPYILSNCEHPVLTPEEISATCKKAGCHLYIAPGDVLHASTHWILLHAAASGEKTIRLPEKRQVRDVFTGEEWHTDTLVLDMRQYETRLFWLV